MLMRKILSVFILIQTFGFAQESHHLQWSTPIKNEITTMIWFEGAAGTIDHPAIPSYCSEYAPNQLAEIKLSDVKTAPLTAEEHSISAYTQVPDEFNITQTLVFEAGQPLVKYCVFPVRRNATTGHLEKLLSFTIKEIATKKQPSFKTLTDFDENSPLATGNWYRIAVSQTGVYKITPQFLADCGFSISNLASANIRVFGNGAGMLPEANDQIEFGGLKELAIWVVDGGDGIFNGNDYALFYANGPHVWQYSSEHRYDHIFNVYDEKSYYFISLDNGAGKRIIEANEVTGNPNSTVKKFDDLQFREDDLVNLVGSGRRWFGDLFDFKTSYDYTLQFNDIAAGDTAWLNVRAVARSLTANTVMQFRVNNNLTASLNFPAVGTNPGNDHVTERHARVPFTQTGNTFSINVQYQKSGNMSATAWLDHFSIQVRRNLNLSANSLIFRDSRSFATGGIAQFELANATGSPMVWDVTNHNHARLMPSSMTNNTLYFKADADSLRTFVAVRGNNFPLPERIGSVANQNLHALENIEMVIVVHPNFLSEANRLADFNRTVKNQTVAVVTPQEIYNEFSSGMQDITAIKLMLRNIYDKNSQTHPLKYVLLFGDASYDYKNRLSNMHNFVPIYQSVASFSLNTSFCTDDYFGYLDPNEGKAMLLESLDLGIGRLPVTTAAQAKSAVDKIIDYQTDATQFGDWRNRLLFVADDVDASWEADFVRYMDRLAEQLDTTAPNFNSQKIYIDAYNQTVMAGSQRYPQAQEDLFRTVQRGTLITSYLGHGGEVGWAKERTLQLPEINSWTNYNWMPLFVTITCEFTRLDDPLRVSGGEQTFLNPNGGAISLISTMRPIYATSSTYNVNRLLHEQLLYPDNGSYRTLGEAVKNTKNFNSSHERVRFVLVGDPSMHLAIPKHQVYTDSINRQHISVFNDTLNALSRVRLSGYIGNNQGAVLSDFNGIIFPTVYDKKSPRVTLMNDGIGPPIPFETQENIIFRGKVSVTNGRFDFEFIIPLDINFAFGEGKISYYAASNNTDAQGNIKNIVIGGLNMNAPGDITGPLIRLFINDTSFISGGITDQNPIGLALIADSSGINTVGSGIGHDIIGILNGNTQEPIILNDYFTYDLDSYTRGTLRYPFFNLDAGEYSLMVRAWDVFNNFSEATIKFIVDDSPQIALKRVFNYPNPFNTFTTFQFEHNRAGEPLDIEIHIYNSMGEIVKTFNEQLISTGNRVDSIEWDGTSNQGHPIGSGVYLFRVRVKSQKDNSEALGFSRLVFIK